MNLVFIKNKLTFEGTQLAVMDDFISARITKDHLTNDFFSFLHLMIQVLKTQPDPLTRGNFKKTTKTILSTMTTMDIEKYRDINRSKEVKDEFERIVQYLSIVAVDASLNLEL